MRPVRKIMLLGSGEMARELAIAARALGLVVIVVDDDPEGPAMALADDREDVSPGDGSALRGVVGAHQPDLLLPVTSLLDTAALEAIERSGLRVAPGVRALRRTTDRETARRFAAEELGLRTPAYRFAGAEEELRDACDELGYPCVVKSVVARMDQGQSIVAGPAKVPNAWEFAVSGAGGGRERVLVEEYLDLQKEITLLTVRQHGGETLSVEPIAHRRERGEHREAWMPAEVPPEAMASAREMARKVAEGLGGEGLIGVDLFVTQEGVYVSEIVPGPVRTGMLTLLSQDLSQFDLHLRATLALPIPTIRYTGATAAAVIVAGCTGRLRGIEGLDRALEVETSHLRLFGRRRARAGRSMGVAMAAGPDPADARARALESAARVEMECE